MSIEGIEQPRAYTREEVMDLRHRFDDFLGSLSEAEMFAIFDLVSLKLQSIEKEFPEITDNPLFHAFLWSGLPTEMPENMVDLPGEYAIVPYIDNLIAQG